MTAGFPAAADRLRADRAAIGARGLEIALDATPGMRERYDEIGLRSLLRDTDIWIQRIAEVVASDDPAPMRELADQVAPVYRRRRVSADDAIALLEGLRSASARVLAPAEIAVADRGVDAAVAVFREYRKLAGDARRKNPILQFLYKGG